MWWPCSAHTLGHAARTPHDVVPPRCVLQVSGILSSTFTHQRPLIILNDKTFHTGHTFHTDKRLILEVEALAADLRAAYPDADVLAVRFRDLPMIEQIQVMSGAQVFITTAGSSSHMAVFMRGGHVILLGGPEDDDAKDKPWTTYSPFDELDRWFPLTYVQFLRYSTDIADTQSYTMEQPPGVWQPPPGVLRDRWNRYNANIRVNMTKLLPMLDAVLGTRRTGPL